jgi:Recombinase zinc beta ribbon domain/Recombinase
MLPKVVPRGRRTTGGPVFLAHAAALTELYVALSTEASAAGLSMRSIFTMYATGQHTDRTLTAWLNLNDQRTTRGHSFGVDTVGEMLCNAAYAGYVSARRDTSKAIKGLHKPVVEETVFDRVQLMRRQRARTLSPGRPSPSYLLRGLARCRRCHGRMQGTTGGRQNKPRYYCSTRRADNSCDQSIIPAEQVERQLAEFLTDFTPGPAVLDQILQCLSSNAPETGETTRRRTALDERLRRTGDLYELGDLNRPEYIARRDAIHAELDSLAPNPIPDLDEARKMLEDFTIFWTTETDPGAKRQFLGLIFAGVWLDEQRVVAVQPKPSFLLFFEDRHEGPGPEAGVNDGSHGGRVRCLPPGEIEVWRTTPLVGRP